MLDPKQAVLHSCKVGGLYFSDVTENDKLCIYSTGGFSRTCNSLVKGSRGSPGSRSDGGTTIPS